MKSAVTSSPRRGGQQGRELAIRLSARVKGSRYILGHWWAIARFLSLAHTTFFFWAKSRVDPPP